MQPFTFCFLPGRNHNKLICSSFPCYLQVVLVFQALKNRSSILLITLHNSWINFPYFQSVQKAFLLVSEARSSYWFHWQCRKEFLAEQFGRPICFTRKTLLFLSLLKGLSHTTCRMIRLLLHCGRYKIQFYMIGKIWHKWWLHTQPSSQVSVQPLLVLMNVKHTQSWCEYFKKLKKVRKGPVLGLYCQKICKIAQLNQSSKPNFFVGFQHVCYLTGLWNKWGFFAV